MSICYFKLIYMKPIYFLFAFLFSALLFSCNKDKKQSETIDSEIQLAEVKQSSPPSSEIGSGEQIPIGVSQSAPDSGILPLPVKSITNPDWEKKIIKTATLRAEVTDFKNYTEKVHQTIKLYGGYIAQEDQNLSPEKSETVMSVKVPVIQFEPLLNQLHGKDVKITERKIITEDVTGQIVDTRARLEAKKQMRLKKHGVSEQVKKYGGGITGAK